MNNLKAQLLRNYQTNLTLCAFRKGTPLYFMIKECKYYLSFGKKMRFETKRLRTNLYCIISFLSYDNKFQNT